MFGAACGKLHFVIKRCNVLVNYMKKPEVYTIVQILYLSEVL